MDKQLTDAELSLAVAKVIWPEYLWGTETRWGEVSVVATTKDFPAYRMPCKRFDYRTDDALGKMAVWASCNENADISKFEEDWLQHALSGNDPHRTLAELVREIGGSNE